jgi:ribosomal protein L37AE/L43A
MAKYHKYGPVHDVEFEPEEVASWLCRWLMENGDLAGCPPAALEQLERRMVGERAHPRIVVEHRPARDGCSPAEPFVKLRWTEPKLAPRSRCQGVGVEPDLQDLLTSAFMARHGHEPVQGDVWRPDSRVFWYTSTRAGQMLWALLGTWEPPSALCTHCQGSNTELSKPDGVQWFCRDCSRAFYPKLAETVEPAPPHQAHCPDCGSDYTSYNGGIRWTCQTCGRVFHEPAPAQPMSALTPKCPICGSEHVTHHAGVLNPEWCCQACGEVFHHA